MAMTKGDFEAIAEAVADAKRRVEYNRPTGSAEHTGGLTALAMVTEDLADACAQQHKGGGFKRDRFYEACGFPELRAN